MKEEYIDFVLPWVDPTDTVWQKDRMQYDKKFNLEDKSTATRFRDMNTLKYVLRSIEQYCPWYNKIYLITIGHYPKWLNVEHPKIELITHKELFIDKSALPVFNSNAIEMNLVNIQNLSETFVYFNDDMLIWKPLTKERFFKNSKPVDFFSHSWIPRNWLFEILKGKDTWVDAINNNIKLINTTFPQSKINSNQLYHKSYTYKIKINNFIYRYIYKKIVWINHWHHPQPYIKSTLKAVFGKFREKMIETSKHKFRSSSDITPYLYRYWHLMSGDFEPYFHNDGFVAKISSFEYLKNTISRLEEENFINFVCFNDQADSIDDKEFEKIALELTRYLESKFPQKASFEI